MTQAERERCLARPHHIDGRINNPLSLPENRSTSSSLALIQSRQPKVDPKEMEGLMLKSNRLRKLLMRRCAPWFCARFCRLPQWASEDGGSRLGHTAAAWSFITISRAHTSRISRGQTTGIDPIPTAINRTTQTSTRIATRNRTSRTGTHTPGRIRPTVTMNTGIAGIVPIE
jgi:hypothetical protein